MHLLDLGKLGGCRRYLLAFVTEDQWMMGVGIWAVISKVVTAHQRNHGMMLLSESPQVIVEWPTLAWDEFMGGDR